MSLRPTPRESALRSLMLLRRLHGHLRIEGPDLGFRVEGLGFRVEGLGLRA